MSKSAVTLFLGSKKGKFYHMQEFKGRMYSLELVILASKLQGRPLYYILNVPEVEPDRLNGKKFPDFLCVVS